MSKKKGFTLVELMVVILIVGILAAVAIPLMQGRIDKAKWSEANATAGTIKTAIRAYVAETSLTTAKANCVGQMSSTIEGYLGFSSTDLEGTYFTATDYTIDSIDSSGNAQVTVKASKSDAPTGTYVLGADGSWSKSSS